MWPKVHCYHHYVMPYPASSGLKSIVISTSVMLVLGLKDKICGLGLSGLGLEQYGLGLGGCPWPWIQGQHLWPWPCR